MGDPPTFVTPAQAGAQARASALREFSCALVPRLRGDGEREKRKRDPRVRGDDDKGKKRDPRLRGDDRERKTRALRPGDWSPAKMAAFLRALAVWQNVGQAARAVGMSRQSAYRLRQRLPPKSPFAHGWDMAMAPRSWQWFVRRFGLPERGSPDWCALVALREQEGGPRLEEVAVTLQSGVNSDASA